MSITQRAYGWTQGRAITEYTLDNQRGMVVRVINYGATVTGIEVADRHGRPTNVVLGFDSLEHYVGPHPYVGAVVGRYANRIRAGRLVLDGRAFELDRNESGHTLHGGSQGFSRQVFTPAVLSDPDGGADMLRLAYRSADGEQGFPGNLQLTVLFRITDDQRLRIDFQADADRPTVINPSHHGYFNLAGEGSALDHHLTIAASRYLAVDQALLPVAENPVEGSPFDFRQATRIGERLAWPDPQLHLAGGYDHNWVLDRDGPGLHLAARLVHQPSGRYLEVETTEPGLQFYSGNALDGTLSGRDGRPIRAGDGICLETQHFPNSPNCPQFPSTVLRPGETFLSRTDYRFGVTR